MTAPFIILSLPRSRSAWLASFLSYGGLRCGHDIAVDCASIADFRAALAVLAGTCETGAAFAWRLLREEYPAAKMVVVRRPVAGVMASFAKLLPAEALPALDHEMWMRACYLGELSEQPGVMFIEHRALVYEDVCARLFEHCLGIPHDHDWWLRASKINIQIDWPRRLQRLAQNAEQIAALKAEVAERLRAA